MGTRAFCQLALAAVVSMAAVSQAFAGCWSWGTTCGVPGTYIPVMQVPNVAVVSPIYVVNQGPAYTGPGIVTYSGFYDEYRPVQIYPATLMGYGYGGYYTPWFGGSR